MVAKRGGSLTPDEGFTLCCTACCGKMRIVILQAPEWPNPKVSFSCVEHGAAVYVDGVVHTSGGAEAVKFETEMLGDFVSGKVH